MLVDSEVVVEEWDAVAGSIDMQEVPGLAGLEAGQITFEGVMNVGEYFAILEVREPRRCCPGLAPKQI